MAGTFPVPGYAHLATSRPQGANLAAGQVDVADVSSTLLQILDRVGATLGKTVVIFSGYRTDSYSKSVGGFAGDPHTRGIATDAYIDGRPIGDYPGAVGLLHAFGARSGATDFTYHGKSDPSHVDLHGMSTATKDGSSGSAGIKTPADFWNRVAELVGVPSLNGKFKGSINLLPSWATIENTKARYNPLASTLKKPGSTDFNSVGVQNYATPEQGAEATADTLKRYPGILAVLRTTASPWGNPQFFRDLNTWSGHPELGAAQSSYVNSVLHAYAGRQGVDSEANPPSWFTDPVKAVVGAVVAVPEFLGKITNPHNILRGLQIVAGAVLVLVGVVLLTRQVALAADVPTPDRVPLPGTGRDLYQSSSYAKGS